MNSSHNASQTTLDPSPDATLPVESEVHRFLDRTLFPFELATLVILLVLTWIQPGVGRMAVPTWGLILISIGYRLVVEFLRSNFRVLHVFTWKYLLDVPVAAVTYYVGIEAGGPLFVLFFLAITCATASMTLRGSLIYTGVVAILAAAIDLILYPWPPAPQDIRDLGTRLVVLGLFGAGTAILRERLMLQQAVARSNRDEAERLQALDQLRADFVATVSHDLQTPITAARAGLGFLETSAIKRLELPEQELLHNARRNIERLALRIADLLAYNQIEVGNLRLDHELLDLRTVVVGAMSVVHPLILEKGQTLEVDLPEPLPHQGDLRRLEQVIVNLLDNAHTHTPPGTRITIAGYAQAAEVLLSISDNGPGIPTEALANIFQRFHHFTVAEGGSGLGLTIVRRIIDMHDGRIWADSAPGQGTVFHIALPSAAAVPQEGME